MAEKKYIIDDARLMAEWNWEKNDELNLFPDKLTCGSGKKVWWQCKKCNQTWQARIAGRTSGKGCPVCAGQVLVQGVNDLATINPKLAIEWDYSSNVLTPKQVSARNNIKAAWVCSVCGYRWNALISTRNSGTGCPRCKKNFQTSIPEQIIFFYLKQLFPDTVNGFAIAENQKRVTIDIFIPSLKLAIEYDGSRWHKNVSRDIRKTKFLLNHGIKLVRIRESDCPVIDDESFCVFVDYNKKSYSYLTKGILELICYIKKNYNLSVEISINIENDFYRILNLYENDKKGKSLAIVNPSVASEWDFQKNGEINPSNILATSDKKFWWKCLKCGYSWRSSVYDRNSGHGCPCCAGVTVREGVNDLQTKCPDLILEWDYEKNNNLYPNKISYRSNKKLWWKCQKCGHSWLARVADRSNGVGCPACAGKVVVVGKTDLSTINPSLANEWDYKKNESLTPQMVLGGSNKKVWWICKNCGHSWNAFVYSRNIYGRGCPECAKQKRKESKDAK